MSTSYATRRVRCTRQTKDADTATDGAADTDTSADTSEDTNTVTDTSEDTDTATYIGRDADTDAAKDTNSFSIADTEQDSA